MNLFNKNLGIIVRNNYFIDLEKFYFIKINLLLLNTNI